MGLHSRMLLLLSAWLTYVDQVLVESLLQVVDEGPIVGVVLQHDGVLDAGAVPLVQAPLHVAPAAQERRGVSKRQPRSGSAGRPGQRSGGQV